jgi:hypothetical protein
VAKRVRMEHGFEAHQQPEAPFKGTPENMSETDPSNDKLTSSSKRGTNQSIDLTSDTPTHKFFSSSGRIIHRRRPATYPKDRYGYTNSCHGDQSNWQNISQNIGGRGFDGLPQGKSEPEEKSSELMNKYEPLYDERPPGFALHQASKMGYDDGLSSHPSQYQTREVSSSARHLSKPASSRQSQGHVHSHLSNDITEKPQGFFGKTINSIVGYTPQPSFSEIAKQKPNRRDYDRAPLVEKLREKDRALERSAKNYNKLIEDYEELQQTTRLMADREAEFERQIRGLERHQERSGREFAAEVCKLEAERNSAQEKYEELIRKQQEESFKQMSTAHWLPTEDSKVIGELDRVKREMRGWAKATAVKSADYLEKLDSSDFLSLMESLSQVAVLEKGELPRGLLTPKSPALLLNALLAHHLYTTTFQNPFFFLDRIGTSELLHKIYELAQNCRTTSPLPPNTHRSMLTKSANKKDAHAWRSQTLRLLHPPLGANAQEGERSLRTMTEKLVLDFSKSQASNFMDGAAQYLLDPKCNNDEISKRLKDIYQEAAALSYRLWTQRTTLSCLTLRDIEPQTFDAESEYLKPHPLVRYDEHEDDLKGKPISLIVHPLIQVFGTNEGEDYDSGRIWASGEVWLDSSQAN